MAMPVGAHVPKNMVCAKLTMPVASSRSEAATSTMNTSTWRDRQRLHAGEDERRERHGPAAGMTRMASTLAAG